MNKCSCGADVRLGAFRISVNRKRGVAHYIAHSITSGRPEKVCIAGDWNCVMMKPYPKNESEWESRKLMAKWDNHPETMPTLTHQST